MKLVELKCKNCGSKLKVNPNSKEITCKYCNTTFSVDKEIKNIEKAGYEFEKGRIKAQKEEKERKNNTEKKITRKVILWFILMLICVFIAWVVIININDSKMNYEIIQDGDKTLYVIDDIKYELVQDSNTILIDTNRGIMIADLYPDIAPITVKNIKKLIRDEYYENMIFHRVIKDFMIQTGDPTGTGSGGSEEEIKGEFSENGVKNNLSHTRGILSMARRGANPDTDETRNSASSQFFIVQQDSTHLDGKYAAFGLLTHGYDVLDKIASVQTDEYDKPLTDQVLNQIKFVSVYKE